jgi:hypothetical protein
VGALTTRAGGIVGVVGAVLLVVAGLITGSPPKTDDPASKVVSYLVDKRDVLRWQIVLFAIAIVLILWFTAAFGALMARTEGTSGVQAALPLVGVTAILAIAFAGSVPLSAIVWRGPTSQSEEIVHFAWDANNLAGSFVNIAAVLVFLAAAALIMRSAALPRWLGWLALVVAFVNIVGSFAIVFDADQTALAPGGFIPGVLCLLGAAVWILATSVTMARTGVEAT